MTKYRIVEKPVETTRPFTGGKVFVVRTLSTKNRIFNYYSDTKQGANDFYNKKHKQLA